MGATKPAGLVTMMYLWRKGVSMKNKYYLTEDQVSTLLKLIDDEIELNMANGDGAYNTHWDNIKMAFGYAVIK